MLELVVAWSQVVSGLSRARRSKGGLKKESATTVVLVCAQPLDKPRLP